MTLSCLLLTSCSSISNCASPIISHLNLLFLLVTTFLHAWFSTYNIFLSYTVFCSSRTNLLRIPHLCRTARQKQAWSTNRKTMHERYESFRNTIKRLYKIAYFYILSMELYKMERNATINKKKIIPAQFLQQL